ncbi:MAG: hypothetical protein ACI9QL_001831 [Candidatus Omnitrophota bacterium]|jgi:hypothetical protein
MGTSEPTCWASTSRASTSKAVDDYLGHVVILDMASTYIILGTLDQADPHHLTLSDADVHDLRESGSTRDFYVSQAKAGGIRVNRQQVLIRLAEVVGITRLDDFVG